MRSAWKSNTPQPPPPSASPIRASTHSSTPASEPRPPLIRVAEVRAVPVEGSSCLPGTMRSTIDYLLRPGNNIFSAQRIRFARRESQHVQNNPGMLAEPRRSALHHALHIREANRAAGITQFAVLRMVGDRHTAGTDLFRVEEETLPRAGVYQFDRCNVGGPGSMKPQFSGASLRCR